MEDDAVKKNYNWLTVEGNSIFWTCDAPMGANKHSLCTKAPVFER